MFHIFFISIIFFLILVGVLMVPLSLPGTWVIALAGLLFSLFDSFDAGATSALWVLGWLLGLALFGEIMEFLVGTVGGKAVKISNGAILAAFIGGLVGLFVGVPVFLVGSLVGLFVGSFLAALVYEWVTVKSFKTAIVTACAVLATRMVATFLKTVLAIGMGVFLGYKIF